MTPSHQSASVRFGFVALPTIVVLGIVLFVLINQPDPIPSTQPVAATTSTPSQQVATSTPATTPSPIPATSAATYTDGAYAETISYQVPGATNSLTVTLTLSGDTVTKVATQHIAAEGESTEYHTSFDASVTAAIVGKKIDDITPSRIGGASLTTGAFTKALTSIKASAGA